MPQRNFGGLLITAVFLSTSRRGSGNQENVDKAGFI
jgi:hypothetical protein